MSLLKKLIRKAGLFPKSVKYHGLVIPVTRGHMPLSILRQIEKKVYEAEEVAAVLAATQPGDRILEMGTGIGIVSAIASRAQPDVQIRTFDGNATLLPHVKKLHELNGITNITAEIALLEPAPKTSSRMFNIHHFFTESSVVQINKQVGQVEVPVRDLNAEISAFKPTMLVMDIEGAEELVLPETDLSGLRTLILELHPHLISRDGVRAIYDACANAGLYPRVEWSDGTVVTFERVPAEAA